MVGPNLTDNLWIHGCTPADLVKNVATGFPPLGMLPYGSGTKLTDEQLLQVVSYIIAKQGSQPPSPRAVNAEREKTCG
jgi:cytochrome c oxidase cbb3-type subunit 3